MGRPGLGGGKSVSAPIDRRSFLRGAGTIGVGAALAGIPRVASAAARDRSSKTVVTYRLSTYKMDVCQACKGHAAHKYFRTRALVHRAHHGCDCRVLRQRISTKLWNHYFVRKDGSLRKQFDDRRGGGTLEP